MVCYFITPILDKNKQKISKQKLFIFTIICIILQLIMSYYIYEQFGRYLIMIGIYIIAYFTGFYWNSENVNLKIFIFACISMIFALFLRIFSMLIFDNTIFYNVLIVGCTHSLFGLSMFFIGFYIVKQLKGNKFFNIIKSFDFISYEIYLVHYMFICGPVSVLFTNYSLINCFIVLVFSFISAFILNKICSLIN